MKSEYNRTKLTVAVVIVIGVLLIELLGG